MMAPKRLFACGRELRRSYGHSDSIENERQQGLTVVAVVRWGQVNTLIYRDGSGNLIDFLPAKQRFKNLTSQLTRLAGTTAVW